MTVCGIIAEFNPFHKGHAYLLEQARMITNADYLVIVMSGDYVQRGEPACINKYIRTDTALQSGADLVIELPVYFSTGSAQYFARGAISALISTGIVDFLCFGSESGDLTLLKKNALASTLSRDLPNNILGREYLKALDYFNSSMEPVTITRDGSHYHDICINTDEPCSASALRQAFFQSDSMLSKDVINQLPSCFPAQLDKYLDTHHFMTADSLSDLLFFQLSQSSKEQLAEFFDVYDDLANKILKYYREERPTTFTGFCRLLKSKEIAYSHISRALLHIILGLTTSDIQSLIKKDYCSYLRILGFRKNAAELLSSLKEHAKCPIISKLADAGQILPAKDLQLLQKDIHASDLYEQLALRKEPQNSTLTNQKTLPGTWIGEYRQKPIILP